MAPSSHNIQNYVHSVPGKDRALKYNQLSFSIKSPVSPLTLARYYMFFLKNIQHFPASILGMKKLSHPSGTDCSHFCGRKMFSEHPIIIHHFLIYILSQKLYVILIENTSLSCYHNCVVHVEMIFDIFVS